MLHWTVYSIWIMALVHNNFRWLWSSYWGTIGLGSMLQQGNEPQQCIVMITTNTPILALQEFHTMAVVPCLSTGMCGLEPRSIYWEWVAFHSVIIHSSSNFTSTWVLRKISATHLSLRSSKRTDLLVWQLTNLTRNRIYFNLWSSLKCWI